MRKAIRTILSLSLAVAMSLALCGNAFAAGEFEENVNENTNYVRLAKAAGLMAGYDNGRFGEEDTLTHEMWITIMKSIRSGSEAVDAQQAAKFSDVAANAWYAGSIAWASGRGIASGNANGTFGVGDALSRADMAQLAYRYAKSYGLDAKSDAAVNLNAYKDGSSISSQTAEAYRWCLANDLLRVEGNALHPTKQVTRAEAAYTAVMLSRLNTKERTEIAYSKMGYVVSVPTVSGDKMSADILVDGVRTPVTSKTLTANEIRLRDANAKSEESIKVGTFVDITYNAKGEVLDFTRLFDLSANNTWFDTVKYGAEFAPKNGKAGNAIASGWLLDKSGSSVVVGDTNHFEETYALEQNVKVYEINTETNQIAAKTMAEVPVTEKTNGKYSLTPNRQAVVAVFDRNYEDAANAKVIELYYMTPQAVVEEKFLLEEYDTMSQYSYFPDTETGGVIAKPSAIPWIAYTKPFTIVEDKMHFVGDNDDALYLFETEQGLALLDAGWPLCGYIYFQAIEEAGFDPRDIKFLLLAHGHADHYGSAYQFHEMLTNAGGNPIVYETYEDVEGYGIYGFEEIGETISDLAISDIVDKYYPWESWMDFGGVRLYPILTPGHSNGTGSFIFEVTPDGGEAVTFGYMGGFGTIHTPDQGYRRAQFVYGLRYLQQHVEVDYALPQHVAHFPMLEINKAAEAAGISFLDALVPGNDEWCNFLERRMVAQEMQRYHDKFAEDTTIQVTFPDGSVHEFATQKAAAKLVSNEKGGPWKRDAGTYTITLVDGGKLMHGFNVLENPNPLLDGVYNSNGNNLGDGVMITRDGYMHDPDQWFIQVSVHVDDGYAGKFTDLKDALNGPVESLYGEDWHEIVRTQYFDSKEEAEAVLATLKAGERYTVQMDRNSNILLADNVMNTFGK